MSIFIDGLLKLHKQELKEKSKLVRDGLEGYLDQVFGRECATLFNTIADAEGNMSYLVYLPKNEWFKSANYQWFEVYANQNGYHHKQIER